MNEIGKYVPKSETNSSKSSVSDESILVFEDLNDPRIPLNTFVYVFCFDVEDLVDDSFLERILESELRCGSGKERDWLEDSC